MTASFSSALTSGGIKAFLSVILIVTLDGAGNFLRDAQITIGRCILLTRSMWPLMSSISMFYYLGHVVFCLSSKYSFFFLQMLKKFSYFCRGLLQRSPGRISQLGGYSRYSRKAKELVGRVVGENLLLVMYNNISWISCYYNPFLFLSFFLHFL